MSTYNSIMDRASDVGALIPAEYEQQIFAAIPEASFVMRHARRLRNMNRSQYTLRVKDGLATAYFASPSGTAASGDNARAQTSEVSWANKTIKAARLSVVVPIPKDVLADTDYDIWAEIKPDLVEAFGKAFDAAVIHGTDAPSDWPTNLVTGAGSASTTVALGTGADLYDDLLGESGAIGLLEANGYMANGHIAAPSMRAKLRGVRTTEGLPIFVSDPGGRNTYTLDGAPIDFPKNGALDATAALLVTGDWSQLVYSMRQDIEYQILTEASIFNAGGTLQYALAQDNMIALKADMRLGWEILTPPNRIDATPYPFAILTPAA